MKKIKVGTVFSGIGAFEFALKRLQIEHEVIFACDNGNVTIEYDQNDQFKKIQKLESVEKKEAYVHELYKSKTRKTNFVKRAYLANYPKTKYFFEDINLLDGKDFENQIDMLVGGSPCQSFSIVGHQKGLEDSRGTLFHEFARLIDEIKPQVFIYENVRGLYTHDKKNTWTIIENTFKSLGYKIRHDIFNSIDFDIPQNRRRVFVVGFKNEDIDYQLPSTKRFKNKFELDDFLITSSSKMSFNDEGEIVLNKTKGKVGNRYYLSPKIKDYVMKSGTKSFYQKPEIDLKIARPLLATMGNCHRAGIDNYVTCDGEVRMLTEREALRLMGFTDDFKIDVSVAQTYKQAGNSIVVDVLMSIIKTIIETNIFK